MFDSSLFHFLHGGVGGGSQIFTSDLAHVFDKILAYLYTDPLIAGHSKSKERMFSCQQYIGCEHVNKVECTGVNGPELTRDHLCHQDAKNIMSNILFTWLHKHMVYDFTYKPHHLFSDSSKM